MGSAGMIKAQCTTLCAPATWDSERCRVSETATNQMQCAAVINMQCTAYHIGGRDRRIYDRAVRQLSQRAIGKMHSSAESVIDAYC
eukprot:7386799-Prymnesium_polylepis.3